MAAELVELRLPTRSVQRPQATGRRGRHPLRVPDRGRQPRRGNRDPGGRSSRKGGRVARSGAALAVYLAPGCRPGRAGEGIPFARSGPDLPMRRRSRLDGDQRSTERLLGSDRHVGRKKHGCLPEQTRPQNLERPLKHRVLLREVLHRQLADHLLSGLRRGGMQEEACLALWHRADGFNCHAGILGPVFLPEDGDRDLHGNVTVSRRIPQPRSGLRA